MSRNKQALEVFFLLLKFQRKRRMLARTLGIKTEQIREQLNYNEEAVLLSLKTTGNMNVKELAELLAVERSWMSRLVSGLEKNRLVESYTPPKDKRSKKLKLTVRGNKLIESIGEYAQQIMDKSIDPLTSSDKKKLSQYFEKLANGFDVPSFVSTDFGHPIYSSLLVISRGVGITRDQFMGTNLTLTQVQVLGLLNEYAGTPVLARELDAHVPFDASTLSRVLSGFEKNKLIDRTPSEEDRRSICIEVTAKGKKAFDEVKSAAETVMGKALGSFSVADAAEYIRLLDSITATMPVLSSGRSDSRYAVKKVGNIDSDKTLAAFIKNKMPEAKSISSDAGRGECFALYVDEAVQGFLSLHRSKDSGELKDFIFFVEDLNEQDCVSFLKECLRAG